jgi:mRNA interferase MazF
VKCGEVYYARLDPIKGSEQGGTRPVVIASRDVINESSPVVLAVPCTTHRGQRVFRTQVMIRAGEGGLAVDSVAMAEQVRAISTRRLGRLQGALSPRTMRQIDRALAIALDLAPGD